MRFELASAQGAGLKLSPVSLRAKCREVEGIGCLAEGPYTGCALGFLWFIFLKSLRAKKAEEVLAWDQLSESDLNRALINIHNCLKPGGKFWAVVPAHSLNEGTGEIKNYWYREVFDIMSEQLQLMVNKGIVEIETWNQFVLPTHHRHLSQWQRWFFKNKSLFHLDFLYIQEQMNPYLERFRKEHKDPIRFADEYLSSVRAWAEKIITQLLPDQNHRNEFFELLLQEFIKEPARFENDSLSLYVGATRL